VRFDHIWLEDLRDGRGLDMEMAAGHESGPILRYVVGPNGSGKSRLLAALARILSGLSANVPPEIGFELRYVLAGRDVVLTTRPDTVAELLGGQAAPRLERVGIWVLTRRAGTAPWTAAPEWPTDHRGLLPSRVVTLSSGPVSRLGWAVTHARQERIRREMARRKAETLNAGTPSRETLGVDEIRSLTDQVLAELREQLRDTLESSTAIEVAPEDALLAAIALHLHPSDTAAEAKNLVLQRLHASADGVPIAVTLDVEPNWRELVSARQQRTLERLEELALRRINRTLGTAVDDGGEPAHERSLVIGVDDRTRAGVVELADTPRILFETLLMYKRCGALRRAHMALGTGDAQDVILDEDLSDGEFLLLGRYSVLALYQGMPDCLVLLDEPETHFNDEWRVSLIADVEQLLRSDVAVATEVFITTHSDLTLTDAEHQDVYVLPRDAAYADPKAPIVPLLPQISPLAADRGAIAEKFFGVESGLGLRARRIIDDALGTDDPARVAETVDRMGPGFGRFRVSHHLTELRDEPDGEDDGAS
jgi:energy-coupling factor transporter ATP-binding protein EcfA2